MDAPPPFDGMVCWILDAAGSKPVVVGMDEGMAWMTAHGSVRVALDEIGGGEVSTVFLPQMAEPGILPNLYETRLRIPGRPDATEVGHTPQEAEAAHAAALERLLAASSPSTLG